MIEKRIKFENVEAIEKEIKRINECWNLLEQISDWTDDAEGELMGYFQMDKIPKQANNFSDALYYLSVYSRILDAMILYNAAPDNIESEKNEM